MCWSRSRHPTGKDRKKNKQRERQRKKLKKGKFDNLETLTSHQEFLLDENEARCETKIGKNEEEEEEEKREIQDDSVEIKIEEEYRSVELDKEELCATKDENVNLEIVKNRNDECGESAKEPVKGNAINAVEEAPNELIVIKLVNVSQSSTIYKITCVPLYRVSNL